MAFSTKTTLLFGFVCCVNFVLIFGKYTTYIYLTDGSSIRGLMNDTYQSFLGIPYADPPVGSGRFLRPTHTFYYQKFDAVKNPEMCIQMNFLVPNPTVIGSEDCLYLNVYRPNIDYTKDKKLDVMVYIHGGGFSSGSVDPSITGPKYFMKQKSVILVMIQYRLSVLGFLSTGDRESPGNFGLKDQAMALEWIRDNIKGFGGNPDSITIFGHGAGAASVHMHMLSPSSKGLFHKAIAMSGSAIGPYNYPTKNPLELARQQADVVGIENVNSLSNRDLVQKLKKVKAEDLVRGVSRLKFFSVDPLTLYRTVVEPKTVSRPFLTEDPQVILERGDFEKVPFMTGVVDLEGAVRAAAIINNATQLKEFNTRIDELLPKLLELDIEGDLLASVIKKVKDHYLNGRNGINDSNKLKFIQLHTDYSFYYPLYKSLPYMINRIPVYLYKFSYRGQYSYSTLHTNTYTDYGVVHCDDMIYMFDSPAIFKNELNGDDQMASQKLVRTLTSFAKSGYSPKHDLIQCEEKDMHPMCKYTHFYKHISYLFNTKESSKFDRDMVTFWDQILVTYTPYIQLQDGSSLRGLVGSTYQSFLGIPYAEPPIGNLRFANPVPSHRYDKFKADKHPEMCIQMNFLIPNPTLMGSEDCLYLNIYRPNIKYNDDTKLDVMVYIHGGGFFSGTIHDNITGPTYFMEDKSVILIMMQYRLSTLGFLSTGDHKSPGNFGFKDQALALKWINTNIMSFGGNPDSITIFGHGAGATAVHMHFLSPLSRGFFHKAIAMSGSAIAPYNYPTEDPIKLARRQAEVVGIKHANSLSSRDLVKKLRAVSAEELIRSVEKLKTFAVDPLTLYRTVVEPATVSGAFLTEDPRVMLKRGDFARVPFMTGVVDVEGAVRATAIIRNYTQLDELNDRMEELILKLLELNIEGYKKTVFLRKLKDRYLKGYNVINEDNKRRFVKIYTDYSFYYPLFKGLQYMSNRIPVYMYKFSYEGMNSYSQLYTNSFVDYGVVHCDDLVYLFESPAIFKDGLHENDKFASRKLVKTLTAFAKNENQAKHSLPKCSLTETPPMCKYTQFYKKESGIIGTKESIEFDTDLVKFWDELGDYTPYIKLQDESQVRGLVGDDYQSFLGIPYAEPPIGYLRFANPSPSCRYDFIDAHNNPPMCIQINYLDANPILTGSEDCLYLNIYRPTIDYNTDTKLDVMVYIHPGGFSAGTINSSVAGPTYFMKEKSVILVMIQYRLSVLGFLSTGDGESPGNFGLKDQALALKWVKENIEGFGGNPDSITIFGHGAGAASVHMHMLSSLSRGLFNKAIAMSGSAIGPYNYPTKNPFNFARRQAKVLDITDVDSLSSRDLVQKLREVKAEDLIRSVERLKTSALDPVFLYRTVVEPNIREAFLIEDPWTMIKKGEFAKVPFMTSIVDVAKDFGSGSVLYNATLLNELNRRINELLPKYLEVNLEGPNEMSFMKKLKQEFPNGLDVINDSNKKSFIKMQTDYSFYYPLYKSLPYMINRIPVYLYKFSYRGQYTFSMFYGSANVHYGAGHCDDYIYLFDAPSVIPAGLNENDQKASQTLVQTFTAFAKRGTSTQHNLPKCNSNDWRPICKYTHFYKNEHGVISTQISSNFDIGMVKFWDAFSSLK